LNIQENDNNSPPQATKIALIRLEYRTETPGQAITAEAVVITRLSVIAAEALQIPGSSIRPQRFYNLPTNPTVGYISSLPRAIYDPTQEASPWLRRPSFSAGTSSDPAGPRDGLRFRGPLVSASATNHFHCDAG
jgi:hypothetical protein